ncbi:MAG: hypothetical protein NZ736_04110 [Candidatus Poseidoniaceae archaeon]|nr:hypothetical protein [Candidatus Poseidoniaceae archaeon]
MAEVIIETVVCSPAQGREARLLRMLNARQEFKRQKSGCLAAWYAKSSDGESLLLVQSVFTSRQNWIDISNAIVETLDSRDGGLESCLLGPPLVGVFTADSADLQLIDG